MEKLYDIYQDMEWWGFYIIEDENFAEKIKVNLEKEVEECQWTIEEREDLIDRLIDWIWETHNSDKEIMKTDLKYLIMLPDKYIFSSETTNEYVAKSDNEKQFNELCYDFITYKK